MKLQPIVFAITCALALCACDSKQEEARKKALENRADALEDQAKATKKAADADADATKKSALGPGALQAWLFSSEWTQPRLGPE